MGKRSQHVHPAMEWQEPDLEGHLGPRDCPFASPLAFPSALGSHPLTTDRATFLSWPFGLASGLAMTCLVHALLLGAPAHDREGISFEALTGNHPPAPRQLAAAGDSLLVSFPSLGMKSFKNQKSKPPPTLVLHGANPGKAGG